MSKIVFCCVLALGALGLSGCGGGGGSTPAAVPLTSTGHYGSLQFTLSTQSSFARGQQVPLTFTVKNTGTQTVNIEAPSSIFCDAEVTRDGGQVWQRTKVVGGLAAVYTFSLAPNEVRAFDTQSNGLAWDQKDLQGKQVTSGAYQVTVWFQSLSVDDTMFSPEEWQSKFSAAPLTVTIL